MNDSDLRRDRSSGFISMMNNSFEAEASDIRNWLSRTLLIP
jgi:hypothetical protein